MAPLTRTHITPLVAAVAAALAFTACAPSAPETSGEPDDGSELTMWVRSDGIVSQALVDEYNRTHENTIELTIVPGDSFLQVVGAAAGSSSLPDLLASDVVYSPNYVAQGLYQDITDRVEALPFVDDLTPAHSQAASLEGQIYGVPHVVDSSLLLYNKDLFEQAGLDPDSPPTNFEEIYDDAAAIRDNIGGDTYGFYFAGNCAGCSAYTIMPNLTAASEPPLEDDGATSNLDTDAMVEVLSLYQRLVADDIAPSSAATEDGSTWSQLFTAGKVGMIPIGNFLFGDAQEAGFEWGITPLMSPDGSGTSTFVGGDVIGVSRDSEKLEQAWNFIEWSLSEEAQVEVIAQLGSLPSRVDLAENVYSAEDPRIVATIEGLANGYTPATLPYGEIYNASTGPWLQGLRAAIFNGEDPAVVAARMQEQVQSILDDA